MYVRYNAVRSSYYRSQEGLLYLFFLADFPSLSHTFESAMIWQWSGEGGGRREGKGGTVGERGGRRETMPTVRGICCICISKGGCGSSVSVVRTRMANHT